MMDKEIIELLKIYGLSKGSALGHHSGKADIIADRLTELIDENNRQKAEIERLSKEIITLKYDLQVAGEESIEWKSTAIKEFEERLWEKLLNEADVAYQYGDFLIDVFDRNKTAEIIDELVEEMTEGKENA